jgi:Cu2+-exporting ATPase
MTSAAIAADIGCPSGLEPPTDGAAIDPAPFVRRANGLARLDLAVFGAKCGGCIRKIEAAMSALPDMRSARLNLSTGRLSLIWKDGAFLPRRVTERLGEIGYRAAPFDPEKAETESDREGRRLLRALAVAGFASANIMLLSVSVWSGGAEMGPATVRLLHFASALIAIPAALYAGRPFFSSALDALKVRRANMDVPISLGVLLALSISVYEFFADGAHTYFDAAVMLLFFLLIGRYLDHRLRLKARAAARDLLALQAVTTSRLNPDGTLTSTAARDVRPGDRLLLAPGDRAPVDGVIEDGSSNFDLSLVTGESAPIREGKGAALRAGVLNLTERVVMRATSTVEDSFIADLTRLIEAGEQTRSRYVRLADRAAQLYVPVVHTLAFSTFLAWYFVLQAGFRVSLMNAVALLIITCPCALGLAAPAVQVVATGRLFRLGVLVKSGDALERLAEIAMVVFDKTGTLTFGKPRLANRADIASETLAAAAQLARVSRHPLSRAIVVEAGPGKVAADAVETPGDGVAGTVDGAACRLGKAHFVGAAGLDDAALEAWFRKGEAPPVRLVFEDGLRRDARDVIRQLTDIGLDVEMLSGDRDSAARRVAVALDLEVWRAGLSPEAKTRRLEELRARGVKTAMVGDGLNDAPALAVAHASLSPGAAADASQAAADFVYQGDGLAPIVEAIRTARKARRRMLENFIFAALYNLFAMPLAAFGMVTPLIAAIAMSGSSIIVTLNALRLAGDRK